MRDDDFNLNERDYDNERDFRNNEYSEENLRNINDINDLTESSEKSKRVMFGAILFAVLLIVVFVVYTTFFSDEEDKQDTAMEFLDESEPFFIDTPSPESETMSSGFEEVPAEKFSKDELLEDSYSDSSTYLEPVNEVVERSEPTFEKRSQIAPEPVKHVEKSAEPKSVITHPAELVNQKKTYIQTGTFFKYQPNKKYLANIKTLGFQYHIDTYISSSGKEVTRVLVGPFDNYNSAKEILSTVQDKIEKSSFLTTTKLH